MTVILSIDATYDEDQELKLAGICNVQMLYTDRAGSNHALLEAATLQLADAVVTRVHCSVDAGDCIVQH